MEYTQHYEDQITQFADLLDRIVTVDDMFPPDASGDQVSRMPKQPLPSDAIGRYALAAELLGA